MDSQQPQPTVPAQSSPIVPPTPAVQSPPPPPPPPPPPSSIPTDPSTPATPPPPNSSHKKLFVGLVLVFILLSVGLGLYTLYVTKSSQIIYQDAYKTRPQMTSTVTPSPTTGTIKSGDAQLDQQSVKIDAGLDSLNSDISNVDKGLKDQPTDLSQ